MYLMLFNDCCSECMTTLKYIHSVLTLLKKSVSSKQSDLEEKMMVKILLSENRESSQWKRKKKKK